MENATHDYERDALKAKRDRYLAYKGWVTDKKNRKFWMTFNAMLAFFSAGFCIGTYMIVENRVEDCGSLKMNQWFVIVLHCVNTFVALFNLCGLEMKICTQNAASVYIIFVLVDLIFMQVSYFNSQYYDCAR